ncbi:MAG: tail fiber domain-containing protein, partial [Alphaproteobacteria bacterium]
MKTLILKAIRSSNAIVRNLANHANLGRGSFLIPLVIACFLALPKAQAVAGDAPGVPRAPQKLPTGPEMLEAAPAAPLVALPGFNTADGDQALFNVTTGSGNSAFGWRALFSDTTGNFNTGIGGGVLVLNNGDSNTAVGAAALLLNTSGTNNTAVGTDALVFNDTGSNNTALGAFALFDHVTGTENTAVGGSALNANNGSIDNTAVGFFALLNNVGGNSNTAIGAAALRNNVSGNDNQALGRGALRFNEGSGNIAIGREAGATPPATGQYNNTILLGVLGDDDANNPDGRAYIGNIRGVATGNADAIPVLIDSDGQLGTVSSSRRFKKDIKPMDQTSEAILKLKPVTFHYKDRDTKKAEETPQYGLIAEDVAAVNPDLIVRDKDG